VAIVKFTDVYEALGGVALIRAFTALDHLLWQALDVVAQVARRYLSTQIVTPVARDIMGATHGRKWFLGGNSDAKLGTLVACVGAWQRGADYAEVVDTLAGLGFYRDTIRTWVERAIPAIDDRQELARGRVRAYLQSYLHIRGDITEAYLPLVWSIASRHGSANSEDLYQIGVPGLVHAIERYNNDGPLTFGKFASRWIRQSILMHLTRQAPIIIVSHSVVERERRLKKRELETGVVDTTPAAEAIRNASAPRDVSLVADIDVADAEKPKPRVDLSQLPKDLRRLLVLRYGTIDLAQCNASEDELLAERQRQETVHGTQESE
jgi:RNA polymerase sigma factor (sigma-70 family)